MRSNLSSDFQKVIDKLNIEVAKIKNVTTKGMVMAAAAIHEDTLKTIPKTPMDTGNLRASWFVVTNTGVAEGKNPTFKNTRSKKQTRKLRATRMKAEHPQILAEMLSEAQTDPSKISVIMGYSANYGLYVHEMEKNKQIHWTTAGTGGQWLEEAFKRNQKKILKIIQDNAKLL
jgi:hypothetical protein